MLLLPTFFYSTSHHEMEALQLCLQPRLEIQGWEINFQQRATGTPVVLVKLLQFHCQSWRKALVVP